MYIYVHMYRPICVYVYEYIYIYEYIAISRSPKRRVSFYQDAKKKIIPIRNMYVLRYTYSILYIYGYLSQIGHINTIGEKKIRPSTSSTSTPYRYEACYRVYQYAVFFLCPRARRGVLRKERETRYLL